LWTCGTAISPVTLSVAVSTTSARFVAERAHEQLAPIARHGEAMGIGPTSMLATILSLAVSITLTAEAPSLLT